MNSITSETPREGPKGQLAHPLAIEHTSRLERKLYTVGDNAWCMVGNGLSNQTFVRGPEGLIAIDTGESVEEMRSALTELRQHTDEPVVACIYSHFHYVNGTQAIAEEPGNSDFQIYAHSGIEANLARFGGEIAPRSGRGLVHQFGTSLPRSGADGLLHCGLGLFYRNPEHAPFTAGYIPAQHTFDEVMTTTLAGLEVHMVHAPSDATDSITIWFPDLSLCVNNLVWPALFNVYAIRGEEYRDPRILLDGIDQIAAFKPQHLACTHGPPLSGPDVSTTIRNYRDSIQFLWDQTVRGANQGVSLDELVHRIRLPSHLADSYFTQELYGLAEHHVRQIHAGLFGWFDENEGNLFPLPTADRAERLIEGFGGREVVRDQAKSALESNDHRWALELASWLACVSDPASDDQQLLAGVLRAIARQTPSANLRNWCLTKALALEGDIDLSHHYTHRFSYRAVANSPPGRFIPTLRVLVDPARAEGMDKELAWHFPEGVRHGLHVRNSVAVPTDGTDASLSLMLSTETWAEILANKTTLSACLEAGIISVEGEESEILAFFQVFEHGG